MLLASHDQIVAQSLLQPHHPLRPGGGRSRALGFRRRHLFHQAPPASDGAFSLATLPAGTTAGASDATTIDERHKRAGGRRRAASPRLLHRLEPARAILARVLGAVPEARVTLHDLSDRELMDIGLTRGEIDHIAPERAIERLRDRTMDLWRRSGM
ncbi:DUF1127 domain-containing protein [Bradyrhizobium sp. CB1015]|uniref:DUF1127 domain-containing protein n=1 Tax=Bradyrhizobium sp. CB1015 TaxID=2976822 RepID=UPI00288A9F1B|nr:DUF1127 domain-containing protein [Bradyrhizobium sp. CB1015]